MRTNNKYGKFILTIAVLSVTGCSFFVDRTENSLPEQPADIFTLTAQSDKMLPQKVTTKSSDPKDDAEKEIRQLYLFFFDYQGQYLATYQNRFIGFQMPGAGQSTVKIDRNAVTQLVQDKQDKKVTVYAVANVDESIFEDTNDNNIPDNFEGEDGKSPMRQLQEYIYRPNDVILGFPEPYGMPMIGSSTIDFTDNDVNNEIIEMKALMARIDISISLDSEIEENNLPALNLMEWRVINAPTQVPFSQPGDTDVTSLVDENGGKRVIAEEDARVNYNGQTLYNRNGQISFSFYIFENIQNPDWDNPEWAAIGNKYPEGITEEEYQRYKPYIADKENATAVKLRAFYSTYNDDGSGTTATYDVTYTLYLGSNHTDDFKIKRNHQYKNDITIKGLTQVGNNPDHITFDARVNVVEDNPFYISILRERNHDAHFCVTPMDVYLFADKNEYNPTMEVILGEVPDDSETPIPGTVPDWIRMERIPAENMKNGAVPADLAATNDATGHEWFAGNGKRYYFTSNLLSKLQSKVTIENSRDRVYFYLDENIDTNSDGTLKLENRSVTVTLIYKEHGEEQKRRTMTLEQVHLLPVHVTDENEDYWIYMEQFEEYLNHYDPLDEHATLQIYDGLPWANTNTDLASKNVPQLYDADGDEYNKPEFNIHNGYEYTGFVVQVMGDMLRTLNQLPLSAFEYCYNKNIRGYDNYIPAEYYYHTDILFWEIGWRMKSNSSKWFLPGIRQLERALTQYYTTYSEFQEDYYWSASAGESFNIFENPNGQQHNKARATKANADGGYQDSGYGDDYPNGGYADRTQDDIRIRAFRIDLNPITY